MCNRCSSTTTEEDEAEIVQAKGSAQQMAAVQYRVERKILLQKLESILLTYTEFLRA